MSLVSLDRDKRKEVFLHRSFLSLVPRVLSDLSLSVGQSSLLSSLESSPQMHEIAKRLRISLNFQK
jgi:hypothetical protein